MSNIHLYHGDYKKVLANCNNQARMIFTSGPYNIGSKSDARITDRRNGGYDSKSWRGITDYPDDIPEEEYQKSQQEVILFSFANCLMDNASMFYNHKDRRKDGVYITPFEWILPLKAMGIEIWDTIIWDKKSTQQNGSGTIRPIHEYIFILKRTGRQIYFNRPRYIPYRRRRENNPKDVSLGSIVDVKQPDRNNSHNAPFPLELAELMIRGFSAPGELVCDPYSGSGTTMIAAAKLGRDFIGAELQKKYYDMSIRRAQKMLGKQITTIHDIGEKV